MSGGVLQTEYEFTLPQGYPDDDGTLHRDGVMRLATAADEIKPLKDPRVQSNSSYLSIILLARVVTQLGDLEDVTPNVIENLYVSDLAFLQDLYESINASDPETHEVICPACEDHLQIERIPGERPQLMVTEGE